MKGAGSPPPSCLPGRGARLARRRGLRRSDRRQGYDADALIERLRETGVDVVIPPKDNRAVKRACDYVLYKERNLIERLFQKMKQFRAIATRYDKLGTNFLGAVRLVAAVLQPN